MVIYLFFFSHPLIIISVETIITYDLINPVDNNGIIYSLITVKLTPLPGV